MLVLIDGDILVYRCGFAAQKTYYNVVDELEIIPPARFNFKADADEYVEAMGIDLKIIPDLVVEPLENALQNTKTVMEAILNHWQGKGVDYRLWISGDANYRTEIAKTLPYKGNRDPDQKPKHYKAIRDFLIEVYGAEVVEGQEADDAIGINAVAADAENLDYAIVSIDKDLDMIPGWHYNWVTRDGYYIDETGAMRKFYTQLLTGDRTDNVPGLKGIGPAKAAKILQGKTTEHACYDAVREAYKVAGMSDEYLLEQARLLWIRRKPDEMWVPPT